MAYVSINQVAVKSGSGPELERIAQQTLLRRGAGASTEGLLSRYVIRLDDQTQYALISVWSSREAHERAEDSPEEQAVLSQLVGCLAGKPSEVCGEVVGELR